MHTNANSMEIESVQEIRRRQRLGLILLGIFSLAYGGFIGLCTFAYRWISQTQWGGIPLTVVYGVALIVFSLVIAMAYGRLSRPRRDASKG